MSRLHGLQVFLAEGDDPPRHVSPPNAPAGWNWTRIEITAWLVELLRAESQVIVGIDHGFSFPASYFERNGLTSWPEFMRAFCDTWSTDFQSLADAGVKDAGLGSNDEFRLTEMWTASAKSVFKFGVPGEVASSTHAGIPWLYTIREETRHEPKRTRIWPFDGWGLPDNGHLIVEAYPALFNKRFETEFTKHKRDAWATATWLQQADRLGRLQRYLDPPLTSDEKRFAELEGWIIGVS
jgi:hypothetical protein